MRRSRKLVPALFCALMLVLLAGCGLVRSFQIGEAARMTLTSGATGETVELTDPEAIRAVTDNIESIRFQRCRSSGKSTGWSYAIRWYDAGGAVLEDMVIQSSGMINVDGWFWAADSGGVDTALLEELLEE